MEQILQFSGFTIAAILLGAMLFFSGLVAPVVFIKLDPKQAAAFIRSIFPHYYSVIIILSLISTCLLARGYDKPYLMMALVFLLGLISRQILMPRINTYRDAEIAGDKNAKITFNRLHKLSVGINATQIALLIAALIFFVIAGFK